MTAKTTAQSKTTAQKKKKKTTYDPSDVYDNHNDDLVKFSCGHSVERWLLFDEVDGKPFIPEDFRDPKRACCACRGGITGEIIQRRRDRALRQVMNIGLTSSAINMEKQAEKETYNILQSFEEHIQLHPTILRQLKALAPELFSFMATERKALVKKLDYIITDKEQLEKYSKRINGAHYPFSKAMADELVNEKRKVHALKDGRLLVLKWLTLDGSWNYAILDRLDVDAQTVWNMARFGHEMKRKAHCFKRPGVSAEIGVDRDFFPTSLLKAATTGVPLLLHIPEGGTVPKATYPSKGKTKKKKKGETCQYAGVAGDVLGEHLTARTHTTFLQLDNVLGQAMRARTIAKNKTRLKAFSLINQLDLEEDLGHEWLSLKVAILTALLSETQAEWKAFDSDLSLFDIILLQWSRQQGAGYVQLVMEAIECHNDGHGPESFSLHGMADALQEGETRSYEQLAATLVAGFTTLPLLNIHLVYDPTITQVIANFTGTAHLGDTSRNAFNFGQAEDCEDKRKRRLQEERAAAQLQLQVLNQQAHGG